MTGSAYRQFVSALVLLIGTVFATGPTTAGPLEDAIAQSLLLQAAESGDEVGTSAMVDVEKFYADHGYAPVWTSVGGINERGRALVVAIGGVGADGLEPNDYRHFEIVELQGATTSQDIATLEVMLSGALVRLAQHLSAGRVDPMQVERSNDLYPEGVAPIDVLADASTATDIAAYVESFAPDQEEYRRLKDALAAFRALASEGVVWPTVPDGESIKPDTNDPRIPALRASLIAHGDLDEAAPVEADPTLYDPTLQEAVKRFQLRHGLLDDAVVGKNTIAALNVSLLARIEQIVLNLERRRWMADDRGERYVFVNLSDFQLKVVDHDRTIFVSPIIVGTEYNQTPVFSDEMEYLEFNPYWNVPPKIARNELLPKIQENPGYIAEQNFELLSGWSGDDVPVDPMTIDWSTVSASDFSYKLRQRPGVGNALGRVKFMFPNRFDVYLHDTPSHGLFARETRTFSHGCLRVGDPLGLALVVLAGEPGWDAARIDAVVASSERTIVPLAKHLPVHIAYITAFVNKDGVVNFRRDIYGRDKSLAAALFGPPV
jgi:murein L,D-transpeptidase YcbB/YkuD